MAAATDTERRVAVCRVAFLFIISPWHSSAARAVPCTGPPQQWQHRQSANQWIMGRTHPKAEGRPHGAVLSHSHRRARRQRRLHVAPAQHRLHPSGHDTDHSNNQQFPLLDVLKQPCNDAVYVITWHSSTQHIPQIMHD